VLPAALLIRLITIAATLALGRHAAASRRAALGGSILASAMTLALAVGVLTSGRSADGVLLHHAASGMALGYAVAPLSAWFLMVLGLVAIPVAFYSAGYFAHAVAPSRMAGAGIGFNALLGSMELVFAAGDVMTFLFAWEVMTLAAAALVATDHDVRANRRAAYLFLVMSHVGTGCLVAGFFALVAVTGSTTLSTVLAGDALASPMREGLFVLFSAGFGVKAGVVPLHVWLPEAHPAAPSSISALMSSVLITTGIYGLVRVCAFGLGVPDANWGLAFMAVGAISAILGILYALTQSDLKRLLAYSTIENAGIIVLALGTGMMARSQGNNGLATIAIAASLAHALNHAVFKALLFLAAGSVVMATGSRQIEQFGGLLRRMPWTGLFFLVGALSISGLPLLNGFISEWLTFQALLLGFASTPGLVRLNFPVGGAILALSAALAAACFVKAFGISFLALPRTEAAADARESPMVMLMPQAFLASVCAIGGLFPGAVLRPLESVLVSLPGLSGGSQVLGAGNLGMTSRLATHGRFDQFDRVMPLTLGIAVVSALAAAAIVASRAGVAVRKTPTWGCGGELSARTEYTATAFSKPLMMIFAAVYRPTRQVETLAGISPYFPQEVRYRAEIEPTFERYIYGPLVRGVLRAATAMRVLQAGSLHAYLAYVLVLGVLLLVWLGGTP
jgi:hydrogenase-4 component B